MTTTCQACGSADLEHVIVVRALGWCGNAAVRGSPAIVNARASELMSKQGSMSEDEVDELKEHFFEALKHARTLAMVEASKARLYRAALQDIAQNGCKHDLNPTLVDVPNTVAATHSFYLGWIRAMDSAVRQAAKEALDKKP